MATNEDGFTILETLVALTVLAIMSVMFARSVSSASMQLSAAERMVEAASLGKRLMAETEARSNGRLEGVDPVSGLAWTMSADVVQPGEPGANGALVLVRIEVRKEQTGPAILTLRTIKSGVNQR